MRRHRRSRSCRDREGEAQGAYLDTLALAQFRTGAVKKAVATLRRGVELAPEVMKADYRKRPVKYEAALEKIDKEK